MTEMAFITGPFRAEDRGKRYVFVGASGIVQVGIVSRIGRWRAEVTVTDRIQGDLITRRGR